MVPLILGWRLLLMGFGQCLEPWNLESLLLLTFACAIVTGAAVTLQAPLHAPSVENDPSPPRCYS